MIVCVLAKEPRPGFAKTRLCPPFTHEQAAALAEACLRDTLAAVRSTPDSTALVVLDGMPGPWLPDGVEWVPQVQSSFGDRLDGAVSEGFRRRPGGPVVVIGMDTPQVTPALLTRAREVLERDVGATDDDGGSASRAVLGPATDGGYWLIGFLQPVPGAFEGVPMSTPTTGASQLDRLRRLGCPTRLVDELTDVDEAVSARAVADVAPHTSFARALNRVAGGAHR
jgi:rSAM/selenodomain-associated transferase 1